MLMTNDEALTSQLLPAMQNMERALGAAGLSGKVKVSTVHSMSLMSQSEPPSAGRFHPSFEATLKGLLEFQKENGSPLAVNPYPFFAYQSDPRPETLAFCLFQPNPGRLDSGTGITYMNMFDAQVSRLALYHQNQRVGGSKLNSMQFSRCSFPGLNPSICTMLSKMKTRMLCNGGGRISPRCPFKSQL